VISDSVICCDRGRATAALLVFSGRCQALPVFDICPLLRARSERCVTSPATRNFPTLEAHHSRLCDCG
jgi:hypothetical protein